MDTENNKDAAEALDVRTGSGSLPSDTWDKYPTKYLPGDLVRTEFGPAIIREASSGNGESYSVWPLPGWKWRREPWGWTPVKWAWYAPEELKLIKWGPAHFLRPNVADEQRRGKDSIHE